MRECPISTLVCWRDDFHLRHHSLNVEMVSPGYIWILSLTQNPIFSWLLFFSMFFLMKVEQYRLYQLFCSVMARKQTVWPCPEGPWVRRGRRWRLLATTSWFPATTWGESAAQKSHLQSFSAGWNCSGFFMQSSSQCENNLRMRWTLLQLNIVKPVP